jgi:hypothetical protein
MGYCRFQNTLSDLEDCQDALGEDGLESLSVDERRAAERLIKVCQEIASDFGDQADV